VIELRSEELSVQVDAKRGCEIAQIYRKVDARPLLLDIPADHRPPYGAEWEEWIAAYRGGWQLMLPNAGAACDMGRTRWGFHGEASTRPWSVGRTRASTLRASVDLATAPLTVHRTIEVKGAEVRVMDEVLNRSTDRASFLWGHHPAFGGDLVTAGATLASNAKRVDNRIGTLAGPDCGSWPNLGELDLSVVPALGGGTCLFFLHDFPPGAWVRLANASSGIGVELHWASSDFACAWVWQEFGGEHRPPFNGAVRTCAVEPMTAFPAVGAAETSKSGGRLVELAGGERRTQAVTLRVLQSTELT